MVLPLQISAQSPLDPLLLLPVPTTLPASPIVSLDPLVNGLNESLSQASSSKVPVTAYTAQLRQITRRSHVLLNAARVGAAEAREQLDNVDVELRGVEYERNRVREEMDKCEEYSPAYKEMELTDLETFKSTIGDEILSALPSEDEEHYEHALMIARLEYELAEIQRRETLVAKLTKERDDIIRSKKEIKKKYDAADVYLTDYAKTTNLIAMKVKDVIKSSTATTTSS